MDDTLPDLTLVVPVYNEAGNILPLTDEVTAVLNGSISFELIFVDDGSRDETLNELTNLMIPCVRVIRHRSRCGKSAALVTGFRAARAAWIQTLDGDRQNDPSDILRAWALVRDPGTRSKIGLVAGRRKHRNDGFIKWISSRTANSLRRALLRDDTPDTGCGFKLIRREVAITLPFFDGMHRFLPALTRRAGYEVIQMPVEDRPRVIGVSKYGFFGRFVAGIFDLLGVLWLVWRGTLAEAEEITKPLEARRQPL